MTTRTTGWPLAGPVIGSSAATAALLYIGTHSGWTDGAVVALLLLAAGWLGQPLARATRRPKKTQS